MQTSVTELREHILQSPGVRTLLSAVAPIITGLLSGTFVLEITTTSGLAWLLFYKTFSFYALCAVCAVIYWYNRALYLYEREVHRFLEPDYCIAYMRSKCLPEAAERYKVLIRNGEGGELKQAMDELRKILK